MESSIQDLLDNNKRWAEKIQKEDPNFFPTLAKMQEPHYLWIGCADSRLPATNVVDLLPGDIFVHRNIANQVIQTDLSCLSVVQYAVEVLKVKQIIVCGHYGCGGIIAAYDEVKLGVIDPWLSHIRQVYLDNKDIVDAKETKTEKMNLLCELNVLAQVEALKKYDSVKKAKDSGQQLDIHACIYNLHTGLMIEL